MKKTIKQLRGYIDNPPFDEAEGYENPTLESIEASIQFLEGQMKGGAFKKPNIVCPSGDGGISFQWSNKMGEVPTYCDSLEIYGPERGTLHLFSGDQYLWVDNSEDDA